MSASDEGPPRKKRRIHDDNANGQSSPTTTPTAGTTDDPPLTIDSFRRLVAIFLLVTPRNLSYSKKKTAPAIERMNAFLRDVPDAETQITGLLAQLSGDPWRVKYRLQSISRVGHLQSFYERFDSSHLDERLSKAAMVASLSQAYQTGSFPWHRRQEEERVLENMDTENIHFVMCGVALPKDIMRLVLEFHGFDRSLLDSFALVSWDAFVVTLSCWDSPSVLVPVTKANHLLIPVLVLKKAKRIKLVYERALSLKELRYVWGKIDMGRLQELVIEGPPSWCHWGMKYRDLRNVFRTMEEAMSALNDGGGEEGEGGEGEEEESYRCFDGLRKISFPMYYSGSGSRDRDFPGILEFDLSYFAPNLRQVRTPVSLSWCRSFPSSQLTEVAVNGSPIADDEEEPYQVLSNCDAIETFAVLFSEDESYRDVDRRLLKYVNGSFLANLFSLEIPLGFVGALCSSLNVDEKFLPKMDRVVLTHSRDNVLLPTVDLKLPNLRSLEIRGVSFVQLQSLMGDGLTPSKELFVEVSSSGQQEDLATTMLPSLSKLSNLIKKVTIVRLKFLRFEARFSSNGRIVVFDIDDRVVDFDRTDVVDRISALVKMEVVEETTRGVRVRIKAYRLQMPAAGGDDGDEQTLPEDVEALVKAFDPGFVLTEPEIEKIKLVDSSTPGAISEIEFSKIE